MYMKQSYLDNSLRGGLPVIFGDDNSKVYHTFNRVHGDIERDYNWFQLEPTYFSQVRIESYPTQQTQPNPT